ncbi:MAG: Abi family protein [Magnetococcus sp. MYC-9]
MTRPYTKPPLTFDQQLAQLVVRGLVVDDREQILRVLESTSYYRLSAYWYPFCVRDQDDNVTDLLMPGTKSSAIVTLYEFDRRLRLAIMDATERVEIAVRTRLTYQLAHAHGAFGHLQKTNFHTEFKHTEWLASVREEAGRSKEEFIRHHQETYDGFPDLPIWKATEIMSLGSISILFRGLKHEDKKPVAHWFKLHHKRLADWLHVLTYIRNVCAHHGRLWNRELAIRPSCPNSKDWCPPVTPRTDRVFIILLMLRQLLAVTSPAGEWQQRCNRLLEPMASNPRWRESMGLPEKWREHPLWIQPIGWSRRHDRHADNGSAERTMTEPPYPKTGPES